MCLFTFAIDCSSVNAIDCAKVIGNDEREVRMHVSLIGTGGTIASRQVGNAVLAEVGIHDLLATADLAAIPSQVEIDAFDLGTSPSFALSLDEIAKVALSVFEALEAGADAVVVTHGTDSMEETVFLLDLLHTGDQALAITGAQRPHDHPERDGPSNLAAALQVATSAEARGQGALLVFDQQAWPASGVRKVHTTELQAFDAPSGPRLQVGTSSVRAIGAARRGGIAGALETVRDRGLVPVDVVAAVPGGDGAALAAVVARGSRGIVLQALGIGNVAPADTEQVAVAVQSGIPVLVTSRVSHGGVRPVYGGGGGVDLQGAGAVFAGSQTTWQARILLSLALAIDPDAPIDVVRSWLRRHESDS